MGPANYLLATATDAFNLDLMWSANLQSRELPSTWMNAEIRTRENPQ